MKQITAHEVRWKAPKFFGPGGAVGFGRHLDQCEIHVDRGSGWGLLARDSTPCYTDTASHPAAPAKWRYKAIYRVDDAPVGLWSAEVSVTVGG